MDAGEAPAAAEDDGALDGDDHTGFEDDAGVVVEAEGEEVGVGVVGGGEHDGVGGWVRVRVGAWVRRFGGASADLGHFAEAGRVADEGEAGVEEEAGAFFEARGVLLEPGHAGEEGGTGFDGDLDAFAVGNDLAGAR